MIFTDGMDWHSDNATFNSNVRRLDEEGVIVYPIRYETRATTDGSHASKSADTAVADNRRDPSAAERHDCADVSRWRSDTDFRK